MQLHEPMRELLYKAIFRGSRQAMGAESSMRQERAEDERPKLQAREGETTYAFDGSVGGSVEVTSGISDNYNPLPSYFHLSSLTLFTFISSKPTPFER